MWIALGMLSGTLIGLDLVSDQIHSATTSSPSSSTPGDTGQIDLVMTAAMVVAAIVPVFMMAVVTMGTMRLMRLTRFIGIIRITRIIKIMGIAPRHLLRACTITGATLTAAALGLANGGTCAAFDHSDDRALHVTEEPRIVSIDGVVLADPVNRGEQRTRRLPGQDLLGSFMRSPHGTSLMLAAGVDGQRRYEVQLAARPFPIRAGDQLRVRGWLEPDLAPRNPGGFESAAVRRRRGIIGRVEVEDPALVVRLAPQDAARLGVPALGLGDRLRAVLSRGMMRAIDPGIDPAVRDMLLTMTLGTAGETLPAVKALFARTGLSHFIVISGFHLAVIAGALLLLARRLGLGRRGCGAIMIVASLFFLFLLESQISVMRAGIAGLITGTVLMLDRGWPALAVLALVTIVVLLFDPEVAGEPAFQLSFAAVAALLVLSQPITRLLCALSECALAPRSWMHHRWLRARKRGAVSLREHRYRSDRSVPHPDAFRRVVLARMAARPLGTALAAWIITAPITLLHFGQLACWGVVGSAALAPLASLLAIVGLPAALLGALVPVLALPAGWLLGVTGTLFLRAVEMSVLLPGASLLFTPQPGWWCAVMMAWPFALLHGHRLRMRHESWRTRRMRRSLIASMLVIGGVLATRPWWPRPASALEIVALDLGEGHCVLVRAGDRAVLINAGSRNASTAGTRTVLPALAALDALHLDAVVVTERSMGALSAVPEVLSGATVGTLIVPSSFVDSPPNSAPARLLESARRWTRVTVMEAGEMTLSLGMPDIPDLRLLLRTKHEGDEGTSDPGTTRVSLPIQVSLAGVPDAAPVPAAMTRAMEGAPHRQTSRTERPRSKERRGAQRWCYDPLNGWAAQRFGRQGWSPMPIVE